MDDSDKSVRGNDLLTGSSLPVGIVSSQKGVLCERAFEAMSSGVLVVDDGGNILFANPAAYSLLNPDGNSPQNTPDSLLRYFGICGSAPIRRNRSEARIPAGDGTSKLIEFSTNPLEPDGGGVVVFQEKTEAAQNREYEKRSAELALAGEMVARSSHEIKNPFATIIVGLKTLQRDLATSSHYSHILRLIEDEVNSLMNIINELLDFARPRVPAHASASVESLLNKCVSSHRGRAVRRGIGLVLVPYSVPTALQIDEQGMLRALGTLVQNALDACSKGNIIRIGWREVDQIEKEELLPGFPGKVVSIFVEDNGSGVPDKISLTESHIFKAFVSTKESSSGLGLTVAQDIVADHGGIILVSSLDGRGTKAEILLPLRDEVSCWDCGQSVDCSACRVKSSGTGYYCWKEKSGSHHFDTRPSDNRCIKCNFFRASSLAPFFKSKLMFSRGE